MSINLPAVPKIEKEDRVPFIQYVTPNNRGAISEYQIRKIVRPVLLRAVGLLTKQAEAVEDSIEQMDLHANADRLR